MTIRESADRFRIEHQLDNGNVPPEAMLARGLVGRDGTVLIDAQGLADRNPAAIEAVQELIGGNSQLGNLSTIGADQVITVGATSQAAIFGTFTVYGQLKVYGEVRVGAWPF